jgi:hypothetical protein
MNFKPLGQTEATKHTQKDQKKEKEGSDALPKAGSATATR